MRYDWEISKLEEKVEKLEDKVEKLEKLVLNLQGKMHPPSAKYFSEKDE
jgi:predicted nuclease with TOPRIM domain